LLSAKFKLLIYKFFLLGFALANVVNIFIHTIPHDSFLPAVLHVAASYKLRPFPLPERLQEEKFVERKIF
jgi:hypothetical protein